LEEEEDEEVNDEGDASELDVGVAEEDEEDEELDCEEVEDEVEAVDDEEEEELTCSLANFTLTSSYSY
jgi:hypothetical protein